MTATQEAQARRLALLFAGDLLDGDVEAATIDEAIAIASAAVLGELPAEAQAIAAFALRAGIAALVEATRPRKAAVHAAAGATVTGTIHD